MVRREGRRRGGHGDMLETALIPGESWFRVSDRHPNVVAMYRRHYSWERNKSDYADLLRFGIVGPCEKLVLMTPNGDAVFAWAHPLPDFNDGYEGVRCTIFRNEGPRLSSTLIQEADRLAWGRWPEDRHYTWIWDTKVRSANPGYCFKIAGWRYAGRNKDGSLSLLEIRRSWAITVTTDD